jgi:hypothetical protein
MSTDANYDTNKENQAIQKAPLEDLLGTDFMKGGQSNNSKLKDNASETTLVAYKYLNIKRQPLHESVILAGRPMFICYKNGRVEAVEQINEDSRIIRPPSREECPYPSYEFADLNEVETYINRVKSSAIGIESLYSKLKKEIVLKYVDQDEQIIILLVADIIWSYLQDLFSTTHYIHATGDNETGKSTIGFVFQFTGYRPVRATAISAANYYRTLGAVEPGQCTIIEDEAET